MSLFYNYSFSLLSHYFWQRFFWEWVDPLADGGRTRYHSSSAGILRSISVFHCLSLYCLWDGAELQPQSVCHHDASHQKEKDIKMFGKGEDFQHSKLVSYPGYLCLYEVAGAGGIMFYFFYFYFFCFLLLIKCECVWVQNADSTAKPMWAKSRQYTELNSQPLRPTGLHYSLRIYWASGTKLFINIDLVLGH